MLSEPLTHWTVGLGLRIQLRGQMYFLHCSVAPGQESDLEGTLSHSAALTSPFLPAGSLGLLATAHLGKQAQGADSSPRS